MPPIFLFIAAGALIAGGLETLDQAKKAKAKEEALRRQRDQADILRAALDLAELREEARQRGVDPDEVVAGYLAMTEGSVSTEQVLRALEITER